MSPRSIWKSVFAVVVGLRAAAMAEDCSSLPKYEGYAYLVNNQSDVDKIAERCAPHLDNQLMVSVNYTGSLYLPNIRNISGGLGWARNWNYDDKDAVPGLTAIDLPDLEYVTNSVQLIGLPNIQNFSAPKLETVTWAFDLGESGEVDLRALTDLEYLEIRGDISGLRLDSLRQVRADLKICNRQPCDEKTPPKRALDVSFPELRNAGSFKLDGRFSRVNTPKLQNISNTGRDSLSFSQTIKITSAGGPDIDISFPELKEVAGQDISLEGNLTSVSIPGITEIDYFSLNAYDQLDVKLPLKKADSIVLSGNITSVELPDLNSVNFFLVDTVAELDCDSIKETILTATHKNESLSYQVNCKSSGSSQLRANLGLAAFVALVGLAVLC